MGGWSLESSQVLTFVVTSVHKTQQAQLYLLPEFFGVPEEDSRKYSGVFQKNPRVRKIFVRNSGAGKNLCVNFMDAWKNAFFLQENLRVHKIPRFRGGVFWGFWGGGGADFIIMGASIFLSLCRESRSAFNRTSVPAFSDWIFMSIKDTTVGQV